VNVNKAEWIKNLCYDTVGEGERIAIDRRIFEEAFPCGFPSIYKTPEQAFLSTMIGSAWGIWKVETNFETGNVIISKHKGSNKRYYVDPDREHLFKKLPDGTYEPI